MSKLFSPTRNSAETTKQKDSKMRNIKVIREADMSKTVLYAAMKDLSEERVAAAMRSIKKVAAERSSFEASKERMKDGVMQVSQSPDIKFVDALIDNESVARFILANGINVRSLIHPASQKSGKSSSETSNMKSYEKFRQIAETIWTGNSDLQKVAKVFAVCSFHFATKGNDLLTREYCKGFLSSREFANLDQASADLWTAIDDIRAKEMSGGAETQSGQMVRQFVAMNVAEDVKEGRNKHARINPNAPVMQALMMRLGQLDL